MSGLKVAPDIDTQQCLTAARRLGDQLATMAHRRDGRVGWLGLATSDDRQWEVRPCGEGLGDGYPGIALFLAKLAELTGEERYGALARQALAHVPVMLERAHGLAEPARPTGCGPFHGITGLGYGLVHVAASLDDAALLDACLSPIAALAMMGMGGRTDVAGGNAGCLAAMLAIGAATAWSPARRVAEVAARRLVVPMMQAGDGQVGVSGFAWGRSGVGWALLRYAGVTGQEEVARAGLLAFRRERGPNQPGWCRGAAGIGLARLDSGTADLTTTGSLDAAVRAVVAAEPAADLSLCHGELGCLEFLTLAVQHGRPDLAGIVRHRATQVLDRLERDGPICGTPSGVTTPGLLTGLAGIGYGVLRLGFPDWVPSVLLLQPPRPISTLECGGP